MNKRLLALASALAVVMSLATGSAVAEQRGTTCAINGTVKFKPGLTVTPGTYGFSFTGKLTDCQSTGDATSASVKAKGKANAACEGGTAEGTAVVKWNTGKKTTVAFSTVDVGASITLRGTVTKSTDNGLGKGDNVLGELAFQADATQCASGLKSASFTGQVGGGSPT